MVARVRVISCPPGVGVPSSDGRMAIPLRSGSGCGSRSHPIEKGGDANLAGRSGSVGIVGVEVNAAPGARSALLQVLAESAFIRSVGLGEHACGENNQHGQRGQCNPREHLRAELYRPCRPIIFWRKTCGIEKCPEIRLIEGPHAYAAQNYTDN